MVFKKKSQSALGGLAYIETRIMTKPHPTRGLLHRHRVTIKAVAVFFITLLLSFWLLNNDWVMAHVLDPYTGIVARVTVLLFHVAGQSATAMGTSVSVNGTSLSIAQGCNGVEALALYLAAVFALPAGWKRKLVGVGFGIAGIFVINQIRVIGLFLVAMLRPELLPNAHNYAGQTFVIVMGMALWFFWAEKYAGFRYSKTGATPR